MNFAPPPVSRPTVSLRYINIGYWLRLGNIILASLCFVVIFVGYDARPGNWWNANFMRILSAIFGIAYNVLCYRDLKRSRKLAYKKPSISRKWTILTDSFLALFCIAAWLVAGFATGDHELERCDRLRGEASYQCYNESRSGRIMASSLAYIVLFALSLLFSVMLVNLAAISGWRDRRRNRRHERAELEAYRALRAKEAALNGEEYAYRIENV